MIIKKIGQFYWSDRPKDKQWMEKNRWTENKKIWGKNQLTGQKIEINFVCAEKF